jgi:hypothetical protein
MTNKQKQLYELSFVVLCLRLFDRYRQPAVVFSFLKACCNMYQLDRDMLQQVVMKVMRQQYNLDKVLSELCYLSHRAGADVSELIKFARRPRSTVYRQLKEYALGYTPTCLVMSEKELDTVSNFLYNFKDMGGFIS